MSEIDYFAIPAARRHFVYGVTCYPFARGSKDPIFTRSVDEEGVTTIKYIAPFPGNLARLLQYIKAKNVIDFTDCLQQGCAEDGLIFGGTDIGKKAGHTTLAVFVNDDPDKLDFHFARQVKDGSLISKVPFHDVARHESIKDAERDSGYKFFCAYWAPRGKELPLLGQLQPQTVHVKGENGKLFRLKERVPDPAKKLTLPVGTQIKFGPNDKFCAVDRSVAILPVPAWPPIEDSVVLPKTNVREEQQSAANDLTTGYRKETRPPSQIRYGWAAHRPPERLL